MYKEYILDRLGDIGIIPTAVLDCAEHAVPLAKALKKGGIDTVEVTLRTEFALEGISRIKKELPDFAVGAGTVLNMEQAQKAVEAGADYIVSPGFDEETVKWCINGNIPVIPGCMTATEIQKAVAMGLKILKFFPAESSGGVKACKSLAAPYKMVKFVPTGGINLENISDYVNCGCIYAIGGGWACSKDNIVSENWDAITDIAKESVKKLLGFTVAHVGINTDSAEDGKKLAYDLAGIFGLPVAENEKSEFVSSGIEVINSKGPGKHGHIAVDTNSVSRAEYYLKRAGVFFRDESRIVKGDKTVLIYLKQEFGGFAIHLRQKNN